jgi:O-antigen/teichoic acid export membrane protein
MTLFRNTSSVLGVAIISLPMGLISSVILARFLSLEDRSYFGVAMAITAIMLVIGNLGWAPAVIYRLKKIGTPSNQIVGSTLSIFIAISIFLVLSCFLFQDFIKNTFLSGAPIELFYMILILFPLQIAGNYFCGISRGIDRFDFQNSYRLMIVIGQCIFFIIAFSLINNSVLVAMFAAILTFFIALVFLCYKIFSITGVDCKLKKNVTFPTFKFGLKSWLHALAGNIHERADILMLSSVYLFGDHSKVALYIQAIVVLNVIKILPTSICSALLPHIAGVSVRQAINDTNKVLRFGFFLLILISIFIFLIAGWIVPLAFGDMYIGAVPIIYILLPPIILQSIYVILAKFWIAIDFQKVNIILQISAMILNIVLNLYFIPKFGIMGAAFATTITYTLEALAMSLIYQRYSHSTIKEMFLLKKGDFIQVKLLIRSLLIKK